MKLLSLNLIPDKVFGLILSDNEIILIQNQPQDFTFFFVYLFSQ